MKQVKYWLVGFVVLVSGLLTVLLHDSVKAEAGASLIYTTEVREDIKAGTVLDIQRSINRAEQADADYLIIKLDTPGGLLQSTRTIVEAMQTSNVPIVVYVDQPGGWAFSAGTIILLAADEAIVHPNASIGAAQPFTQGETNETQDEKALEATVSWIRSIADEQGRDKDIAELFVRENLTLGGTDALEQNVINQVASNFEEVLQYLGAEDAEVIEIRPSLTARVLNILSSPFLVSLFITLGSLALLLAIRSGEFEFTAVVGIILLLIGLWGIGVIEFTVLGIGLLLLGAVLVMIEAFDQPGFGLFGAGGILAILAGVFTLSEEPFYAPEVFSIATLITLVTLLIAVVALVFISRALARSIKSKPVSGKEGLIGKEAVVTQALSPKGRVLVEGQSWQAELADNRQKAPKSTKTCIMELRGNTLIVKKKGDK